MTCGIYILRSEENECLWIGKSVDIERRFKTHCRNLRKEIHRADFVNWFISKNRNSSVIHFEILEECSPELLSEKECYWFEKIPPMFYGQKPSKSGKWFFSEKAKKNVSEGAKKAIERKKLDGTFINFHERQVSLFGDDHVKAHLKKIAFNSESGAAAGRKGAGRPNTEEQKRKQSEATKKVSENIIICDECGRPCKGPSALGAHKRTHRKVIV